MVSYKWPFDTNLYLASLLRYCIRLMCHLLEKHIPTVTALALDGKFFFLGGGIGGVMSFFNNAPVVAARVVVCGTNRHNYVNVRRCCSVWTVVLKIQ